MKCRDGLVVVNVGTSPPVLRGELVNKNSREEPVSEGLVCINSRSSSACVEGRASSMRVVGRSPSV